MSSDPTSDVFAGTTQRSAANDRTGTPTSEPALYSVELKPQNSLSYKTRERIILFFLIALGLGALRALAIGAWPVMAFLLLDLGLVWLAFRIISLHMKLREVVTLTASRMIITRTHPRRAAESLSLEPYWVKLAVKNRDHSPGGITISHHASSMTIGHFLRDSERHKLAEDIDGALQRWRAGTL